MSELFHFYTSAGSFQQNWRYTNARRNVTALSNTWTAAAINRDSYARDLRQGKIGLIMPASLNPAALYYRINPATKVWLDIYDGTSPYALQYSGSIQSCELKPDKGTADIQCASFGLLLGADFPNRDYGKYCPYDVGDYDCGINLSAHAKTLIISVSGLTISSDGRTLTDTTGVLDAEADGFYVNGRVSCGNVRSVITNHTGSAIRLMWEMSSYPDTFITITPPCDWTLTMCQTRFNNEPRFGGEPDVPDSNPHTSAF